MANTVIGFVVGVLSAQFNLSSTVPRLVIFMAATFVHELAVAGLQGVVGGRHFALRFSAMFIQALVNSLIGVVAFGVVELYSNKCRARFERFAYHQRQTRSFVSVTYLMACKQARGRGQPKRQPRLLNVCKGT